MKLVHAGLVFSSLEKSDRFFMELLGLAKTSKKNLPAELTKPIFGLDEDLAVLKYGDGQVEFEVFIHPRGLPGGQARWLMTCQGYG